MESGDPEVPRRRHSDLLHFYKSQNKWYPKCSVTNALDERDEGLVWTV